MAAGPILAFFLRKGGIPQGRVLILALFLRKGGIPEGRVLHPCVFSTQGWDTSRSGAPSLRFFYARVGYLKARPANLPHTHLPIIKLTWRTLSIGMPTMTKSHTELSSLKPIPPRRTQRPHVTPPQAKQKRTSAYPPPPPPLQRPVFQTGSADN